MTPKAAFGGEVAADRLYEEDPVAARIRLDDGGVEVETDDEQLRIELDAIFDVRLGPPPYAIEDVFDSKTVTIAAETEEESEVVFVSGPPDAVDRFGQSLYRAILSGTEVAICHPAQVGGRVTDVTYDIGTLEIGSRSVRFADVESPFAVDVDSVIDFSERETELLGERRTVIDLEYIRSGVVYGLELAIHPPRKRHVLGRYLRIEYSELRESLQTVQLPDPAQRLLIRLYARRGRASLRSIQTGSPDATVELLKGLHRQDLVSAGENGVELTPKGWILVTEHFDTEPGAAVPGAD